MAEVATGLEWALKTQPRRRRNRDEASEVPTIGLVASVAAEMAGSGADPSDLEVLKATAIRVLEGRLDRLGSADRSVARILLAVHRPIGDRMDELGQLVGAGKARAVRDEVVYRMAAVLLGRDPGAVDASAAGDSDASLRRFRIGLVIGVASLVVGVAGLLLAVYTDFFRGSDSDAGTDPLGFELSVDVCDVSRTCNDEASAVAASVSGFTPGGFADVEILTPGGEDANRRPEAQYHYRTPLEIDDTGSFRWQYWWDSPMELGPYEVTVTDRATGRSASSVLELMDGRPPTTTSSTTTTAPTSTTATPQPAPTAVVLGEVDLNIRAEPTTQSDIVATAALGSSVTVVCSTRGETVTLDDSDPGNDLWHLIATGSPDRPDGFVTDVFLDTPTGSDPLDGEPQCPSPTDPPAGDLFLPLRPDSRLGEDLQPGEILVVALEVSRPGWVVLDLDCAYQRNSYPLHDGALIVTGHTEPVYWQPPTPITDCTTDLVQGPVVPGTSYYYSIQLEASEPAGSRVVVVARFVNPPVEDTFDGRVVLPQIEIRATDSIANTLTAGTIHAYTLVLTTGDRLLLAFDCTDADAPTETPLQVRGIDQRGVEYFNQAIDSCVPWRAPAPPTDGRYEIQIQAQDPTAAVFYRLGAFIQS